MDRLKSLSPLLCACWLLCSGCKDPDPADSPAETVVETPDV